MTHTIPDRDTQILDELAVVLGATEQWDADTVETIADLVGKARPHPGGRNTDEYPLQLALQQDRRGPDSTATLCRAHQYTAPSGVTFQALGAYRCTDVTAWHAVQHHDHFLGYIGDRPDNDDGQGMFLAGRAPGAMTPADTLADAVDMLMAE